MAKRVRRKNVSLAPAIIKTAKELLAERGDNDFSAFVTNLIKEERQRRHPTPGIESSPGIESIADASGANGGPEGAQVDAMSQKLIADFQQYRARCKAEDPATIQNEQVLFESWAIQKLAGLTVTIFAVRTWTEALAGELERRRK